MLKHASFLQQVQNYVKDNPEVAAHIATFVQAGIEASRRETLERAADMEVALAIAITKRYNMRDELILSKLTKWQGRSAINWDSTIEMLEKK